MRLDLAVDAHYFIYFSINCCYTTHIDYAEDTFAAADSYCINPWNFVNLFLVTTRNSSQLGASRFG